MNFYQNSDIPDDLKSYFEPAPQIGLEETPEEYVQKLVDVFSEVRRVLKDDGTLWLNLGDSYNGSGKGQFPDGEHDPKKSKTDGMKLSGTNIRGLKPKDLIGIPWRVAFALQADGWYLRQDIIWHKPNPMPESVIDRCTKAHEYIFLLSKNEHYYFDSETIKEPLARSSIMRLSQDIDHQRGSERVPGKTNGSMKAVGGHDTLRNKRSVWTVTTKPYKGAHFATFPPDLIRPCILAGAPVGYTVLDPFFGSGTTGQVAKQLGRHYLGIELNPEYIKLANERLNETQLPLIV